jgi:class 3 adenylate cyclase/tetratricopeptide (TPR) repeat protein
MTGDPGVEDAPATPVDAQAEGASIERAIAALEAQRALLGDDVVETALRPLRERREQARRRLAVEQRKLVTVLFADLVDFTVLSRRLDAEDTRAVVRAYFDRWQDVITAHGGTVEKFIGDAVMAVFGLHQAEEDDAHRAVRAALAMAATLPELNEQLGRQYAVSLRMRVGIDSGDVVVSTLDERAGHDFVVVGETVNRASRIQSAAPVDAVLISADTHRQVRGWFSVERQEALALKGIDGPVTTYLVRSERPRGFRLDRAGGVEGVEASTVGRDPELRALQERMWDVVEESRWQVITVVGDAGVGKSRLLLDFDRWLGERPDDVWWFRGRASHSDQNRPGALLRDLMSTRLGVQESDPTEVVRAKAEQGVELAFPGDPQARRHAHLVASWLGYELDDAATPPPGDPRSLRDQATALLAQYFARLSESAPVVMLLEDLHWADDGSLAWLDAADRVLHDRPVLVVATARPSLRERRPHWGEGLAHHSRLPLQPLSRRQSRQLVHELLQHVDRVPDTLTELVVEAAEGNPFYIEELVTWLVDAGVVVRGTPTWRVHEERIGTVRVPSTLKGVLQARLDALSQPERAVLQRASVVGRVFWDDAVDHLDAGSVATTPAALEALHRRELVFQREVSAFDSAREFLFKHALLRDVAYDGVLKARRATYHALTARWLAEVTERSQRADEYAALIAEHYRQAGDPAACEWYLRAARQAASVHALDEATRLLAQSLDVVPTGDEALRFDVLAAREQVLDRQGDRDGQRADLAAMGEAAESLQDPRRHTVLALARSRWAFTRSEYADATRWACEAVETASGTGLAREEAEGLLWWGKALTWRSENDTARTVLGRAVSTSRAVADAALLGESLRYLSMLSSNEGEYPAALELAEQARDVAAAAGDTEAESVVLAQVATVQFNLGRYDEARTTLEQTLPIFRLSGHRYREAIALGNMASIAMGQGHLADARGWCREALALCVSLQDQEAIATDLNVLGQIDMTVGRYDDARDYLRRARDTAIGVAASQIEADSRCRLALLALEVGDLDEALHEAQAAVAAAGDTPSAMEPPHAELALGYVLSARGAHGDAAAAFARAGAGFAELGLPAPQRECEAGLALAELHRGHLVAARARTEPLLEHLDVEGLAGGVWPGSVLRACWQVLEAAGDERANDVRRRAQEFLTTMARRIGDGEMAAGYLSVPRHAAMLPTNEPPG